MVSQKKKRAIASRRTRSCVWFLLLVAISLFLWIGACGRGERAIVAEVNGQRITVKDFQDEMARTPQEMRTISEQNPTEVLDRLIAMTLLLQEAKRRGLVDSSELKDLNKPNIKEGMRRLMEAETKGVDAVTDKEVQAFYRKYREEMGGKPLSEVRDMIRQMILEQKQQEKIDVLVGRLRLAAAVATYPEQLPKPPAPAMESSTAEAFQAALKSGRPSVVDFGSNRCIPCIQLRPVMRALKDAHKDRINVLYVEVDEQRELAFHYKVRLVPTIIFFDTQGREVRREMGFMEREALEKILRDLKFLGA